VTDQPHPTATPPAVAAGPRPATRADAEGPGPTADSTHPAAAPPAAGAGGAAGAGATAGAVDDFGGATLPDPAAADALAELVGGVLLADAAGAAWRDARFAEWLAAEARAGDRGARRSGDQAFLARGEALLARAQARRLGVVRYGEPPVPARAPRLVREGAAPPGGAGDRAARERPTRDRPAREHAAREHAAREHAAREHAARAAVARPADGWAVPVVDLGVAAGPGRELWDEPPARWIRRPDGVPEGRYLALRVVGTSMAPMLRSGDVVLVRADARGREPRAGRVVVARHPDDGYVCKRVAEAGARRLVLDSLEPGHAPVVLPPDPALVVGTVVAAWPGR
jgi:SOS-response transcriptional repressor LexA